MGMVYTILRKGSGAVIAAWAHDCGDIAQLVERCVRNAEVGSSILLLSTTRISTGRFHRAFRFCCYAVLKPTYLLFLNATNNNFEDSLVK